MIGLPRSHGTQRAHCFLLAVKAPRWNAILGAAGNFQLAAYLLSKIFKSRGKPPHPPSPRLTLWWEFRERGQREKAGLDRHRAEMRISFLRRGIVGGVSYGESLNCRLLGSQ